MSDKTKAVYTRFESTDIELIDRFRRSQPVIPTIAEAVRLLIRRGLENSQAASGDRAA